MKGNKDHVKTIRLSETQYQFCKMIEEKTDIKFSELFRQMLNSMINGYYSVDKKGEENKINAND